MKKVKIGAIFFCFLSIFFLFFGSVFAQKLAKNLTSQSTGLLPSNPFYFMKEWGRGVKRAFTFDNLKKVDFDLTVLNQKAAELEKLMEITPNKKESVLGAIVNYKAELNYLSAQLTALKDADSQVNIDKLLNRLVESLFIQAHLLSELKHQIVKQNEIAVSLQEAQGSVLNSLVRLSQEVENFDAFRVRLQNIVNNQTIGFKELRAAEVIDQMTALLPAGILRFQAESLKKDFLLRFSLQFQDDFDTTGFEQFFSDPVIRLKLIDEIRRTITDQEAKNRLTLIRKKSLDQIVSEGRINVNEAQSILDRAGRALILLQEKAILASAYDQAKFYFDQANLFFSQGNFSGAFSQAVLSLGAVDDALWQLSHNSKEGKSDQLLVLKREFDRVTGVFKKKTSSRAASREVEELLVEAERLIGKAGDGAAVDLQEIKVILTEVDLLLTGKKNP